MITQLRMQLLVTSNWARSSRGMGSRVRCLLSLQTMNMNKECEQQALSTFYFCYRCGKSVHKFLFCAKPLHHQIAHIRIVATTAARSSGQPSPVKILERFCRFVSSVSQFSHCVLLECCYTTALLWSAIPRQFCYGFHNIHMMSSKARSSSLRCETLPWCAVAASPCNSPLMKPISETEPTL